METPFLLGVNYWPRDRAMAMWKGGIDRVRVFEDLGEMQSLGLRLVRFFLFWEDVQPSPHEISAQALSDVVAIAEEAERRRLLLMPTFFVGHMSGVNFLPAWTRSGTELVGPFPHLFRRLPALDQELGDVYAEEGLLAAQERQIAAVVGALRGQRAVYAYDLGNEPSLCRAPKTPERAQAWASRLGGAIRRADPEARYTVGTFQGDVEHDTGFWPSALLASSDFLSVHGYPSYAHWAGKVLDPEVLPFLVHLARALAKGGEAMVAEFGAPYYAPHGFSEEEMGSFLSSTLPKMWEAGATGALYWNFSDYAPSLAGTPPFDLAPHELSFGLLRADGTRKPSAEVFRSFAGEGRAVAAVAPAFAVEESRYYRDAWANLCALYARYKGERTGSV
jgi:endo-1,4-beta-mannosidase